MIKQLSYKNIIILAIGMFTGIGISAFSITVTEQAHAQVETERTYIFGDDVLSLIDQALYNDGTPVMASSNLPSITIENFDSISQVDKIAIETKMAAKGWFLKPNG